MSAAINLIPSHRRRARRRTQVLRGWLRVVVGYGLILCLLGAGARLVWGGAAKDLADQRASIDKDLGQAKAQLNHLQGERDSVQKRLQANRAVTEQPDWSLLLGLLSDSLPQAVILQRCALTPIPLNGQSSTASAGDLPVVRTNASAKGADNSAGDNEPDFTVTLAGYAKTHEGLNRYVRRLERIGLFSRVRRLNTRREPVPGSDVEAVSFELGCDVLIRSEDEAGANADDMTPPSSRQTSPERGARGRHG